MESQNLSNYKWYTYHLLDPVTDIVFYVGKGQKNRAKIHLTRALKWRADNYTKYVPNKHLYYKLLKIYDAGLEAKCLYKYYEFEAEALKNEAIDIAYFGLHNLCNLTAGGEGHTLCEESLKKISESSKKFWASEAGEALKLKLSIERTGIHNPMYGYTEDEESKTKRMKNFLAVPKWNKGLIGDPRSKGPPKGSASVNAIKCRLINKDGRVFEALSLIKLSEISGVPLITINRLRRKIYKTNKAGWSFELI